MRRLVLAVYCIYAMSPVYLSAMGGRNDWLAPEGQPEQGVTIGIVWVNVVLASLVDGDRGGCGTACAAVENGEQGQEFILIKKKRALVSETFRLRPVFAHGTDPAARPGRHELVPGALDVPRSLQFRHTDTPLSHHLGLSPPAFLV